MRAMDMGVWLSRLSAPGVLEKLQQRALVETRFLQLFALHDGAATSTLGAALNQAGLRCVDHDAPMNVAVQGGLMNLPLTQRQVSNAKRAHLFIRAFVAPGADSVQAREELATDIRINR